ncbi:MAG TPA: zinc ABC transporter substrate-binding protein, partial [Bacillota bacterium]|nr:zinc ABC transporter substrate-binding protein [Bacillota bacterium]
MRQHPVKSLMLVSLIAILLTGCASTVVPAASDKLTVITTLFPQYDFVREVAGERVEVVLLLPPGIEPHSYEPAPRDIVAIQNADLLIFTTHDMEPWVSRIVSSVKSDSLRMVESGEGVSLLKDEPEDEDDDQDDHDDDHDHGAADPHIWLD